MKWILFKIVVIEKSFIIRVKGIRNTAFGEL